MRRGWPPARGEVELIVRFDSQGGNLRLRRVTPDGEAPDLIASSGEVGACCRLWGSPTSGTASALSVSRAHRTVALDGAQFSGAPPPRSQHPVGGPVRQTPRPKINRRAQVIAIPPPAQTPDRGSRLGRGCRTPPLRDAETDLPCRAACATRHIHDRTAPRFEPGVPGKIRQTAEVEDGPSTCSTVSTGRARPRSDQG